ncbi:MAG: mobile mystery protein A [Balneolaceae bacterium]|nr:mobile mystery protein A [Balneolaceae bacterium]
MDYWDNKLIRKQLDKKLSQLKPLLNLPVPKEGWIRTIRKALGMTTYDLANEVGVDQSRISRIEASEAKGEIKLSTLEKVADSLGVKFVYGFVPKQDLEDIVREQAKKIAKKRLDRVDHSMKLELQGLSDKEKEEELNDLIEKILVEEPKNFWDK